MGLPPPVAINEQHLLHKVLRAIKKNQNNHNKMIRLPITTTILACIRPLLNLDTNHDHRLLWAIATTGVLGLMRLGELLGNEHGVQPLRYCDWKIVNTDIAHIFLAQSKTDFDRLGVTIPIYKTHSLICALTAVNDLLEKAPTSIRDRFTTSPTSPLFLSSTNKPLSKKEFVSALQCLIEVANQQYNLGLNSTHFKGHSLRSGGATSLAMRGVPEHIIATIGRWNSDCYKRYINLPTNDLANYWRSGAITNQEIALAQQQQRAWHDTLLSNANKITQWKDQ